MVKPDFKVDGKNIQHRDGTRLKVPDQWLDRKAERIRAYRAEASKKASMANKRLARLEAQGLTNSPAYQQYIKGGGQRFGVRGKTYNEVQAEVAKLDRFINAQTSTIRGVNKNLKEMAKNTGVKYSNLKELREKSDKFFELSSKVEQYLRTVDDMASAIGYQKIWEAINTYVKESGTDLASGKADIDYMVEQVTSALKDYETPLRKDGGTEWFPIKD